MNKRMIPGGKEKLPIEKIIEIDFQKNYKDRNLSVEQGMRLLDWYLSQGFSLERIGNTIFINKPTDEQTVLFHTISADNVKALLHAAMMFYIYKKDQGFQTAITYFDNPAVANLFDQPFEEVQEVNDENGKYIGIVHIDQMKTEGGA